MAEQREKNIIDQTTRPITKDILITEFRKIGIQKGDILVVHSSLSKIGWVVGGAIDVVEALMEVVTKEGTLIMPAHSGGNSEPSVWQHPSVPEMWWPTIRDNLPPFRPDVTPNRMMGKIADLFRTYPGVIRSNHPQNSFTAWGKNAPIITANQPYFPSFGENSPLGRIYEMGGKILLLGVGHSNNSSLHLAESKANIPNNPMESQGAAVLENGQRKWVEWDDFSYEDEDFPEIGKAFEESIGYIRNKIVNAEAILLSQVDLVDFAVEWMKTHRSYLLN
ncbi:hypothetical protein NEF87_002123 [Candidatus Lokiarchaeum ossiferum]|uniref:Aminoglycoside N(3)-acetyltransferase n=1 Tax=Candidatus Lokiarchaeum ossiferum TaxID=2951803 RepID=A0ABY6HQQ3_9ARCH|nr:hypothetical protein NEF87_002123 [Candidatus Lokiarchaeum sp. B-35]